MKSSVETSKVVLTSLSFAVLVAAFACSACKEQQSTKHVFVDCGSYKGRMIRRFDRSDLAKRHEWQVIAFEANPEFAEQIPKRDNRTVLQQAVWIEDGTIAFYVDKHNVGSTLIKEKKTGNFEKVPLEVPSIDFSKWLKTNFKPDDFVFVNLDIEGAEYEVLDKLLADGTIDLVDKLCIEFHDKKVNVPVERDHELGKKIAARDIAIWYKTTAEDTKKLDRTCFE